MFLPLLATAFAQDLPADCRPDAVFPGEDWTDRKAETAAARAEAIAALEAYAFPPDLDWDDKDRRGVRTDAVLIIQGGHILYERYAHGYTAQTPHLAWSASKTAVGLLAGIAVREGKLSPEDSVCEFIPDLPQENCAITIEHLLRFSSGLDWLETYEGASPTASSVLAMLYGEGRGEMGYFTASHALRDAPGTSYMYSSGDTNVVATALDRALRPEHGARWPHALLLDPLGMDSATWERDGSGVIVGSSYLYATPRDLARLGLLIREDGCWDGQRRLPAGWVSEMSRPGDGVKGKVYDWAYGDVPGRQLWLNVPLPEQGQTGPAWPHAPQDLVAALGHWGQSIAVFPSKDLVVVRVADDRDGSFNKDRFWSLALAVAGEGPILSEADFQPRPELPTLRPNLDRKYEASLFQLGSAFAAKAACSCTFVMGRDEEFCSEWVRVSPDIGRFRVDAQAKTVTAKALGMGRTQARFVDEESGCVLVGE